MKKIITTMLAVAMIMSLGACSGGSSSSASTPASSAAEGSSPAASSTAPIKIGGIGPVSGPAAVYGIAARNGAQIAIDEINAKGGQQYELNYQDDEHDAEKSVNAYNNLKDWGMQILNGTVTTSPALAVTSETFADRVFTLTPSASSTKVIEGKDNVFQICFTDPNQGVASADYLADNKLATKVAVIYNNADAYSQGIYEKFAAQAKEKNLEIVCATTFTDDTATDFSVQLTEAKNAGADLVFLPIYYTPAALILSQARSMGYSPKFFGCDGLDGILTLENFDKTLAEGVMLLTPFSADAQDDATKNFVAKYQAAYGEVPNQFAADGYDCIYAIAQACEKAGVTAEMPAADVCEKLIAEFTSMSFDGITGEGMTWQTTGEVSKAPKAVVIKGGVYTGM
ncbi:MAG: putative branched-chain amino acid transporter branched-chain amino acid-binding protein [Oscillospiraceae bacterium]|jgi:branched-chain amino acid transport system substrate-binding protein|nr:putative branched-chain amino acid transporter branched-chain amino acid-binding protein [Oscillospiraceae bacterium]